MRDFESTELRRIVDTPYFVHEPVDATPLTFEEIERIQHEFWIDTNARCPWPRPRSLRFGDESPVRIPWPMEDEQLGTMLKLSKLRARARP